MKGTLNIQPDLEPDLEPDESITLWRYMSFSSLCEILMNNYIPLIPIQHFSDKSEGRILKEILSKLPNTNRLAVEQTMQIYKETTYVSSWYNAENENAAMWDRYTYSGEGVAVKTNAKLLLYSIEDAKKWYSLEDPDPMPVGVTLPSHIIVKRIKYINYEPSDFEATQEQLQQGNDKLCFFYKMDDYKDESEIRILTSRCEEVHRLYQTGMVPNYKEVMESSLQPVYEQLSSQGYKLSEHFSPFQNSMPLYIESSDNLIEKIVISPYSHNQFIKTVRQTIEYINTCRKSKGRPIFQVSKVVESRRKDWV